MKIKSKIVFTVIGVLSCVFVMAGAAFFMDGWSALTRGAVIIAATVFAVAQTVALFLKNEGVFKSVFIIILLTAIFFAALLLVNFTFKLYEYPTDAEKIVGVADFIRGTGKLGIAVYLLLQILQVVILPLPAIVCYASGALIWDAFTATVVASIGVAIGSIIDYFLGKKFGRRVVEWIAGKETTDKYSEMIGKRSKGIFTVMQILPFFPDDLLCMLAGLAEMNFAFFMSVIVLVRPAVIAFYCYLGSGTVIPFEGWGIPVWIGIAVVGITLAVLSFFYQEKFENFLKRVFERNKQK